jgi:flagellar biogenesis protein FliO
MILAVWLIQLAFQGKMNSLNNFLETKKEKELTSLCRQLISLIFLFVIAILFVVKFQQKMIN